MLFQYATNLGILLGSEKKPGTLPRFLFRPRLVLPRPSAPGLLPQHVARERAPQVNELDPFEEMKHLLAEAMETQSVASTLIVR